MVHVVNENTEGVFHFTFWKTMVEVSVMLATIANGGSVRLGSTERNVLFNIN